MSLQGKVAVVTGASRGIGKAIAVELGKRGAKVVVNYSKSEDGANEAVEAIKAGGSEAVAVQADVTASKAATALIKSAVDTYGRIDILVNNAGTTRDQVIMMMPEEDWDAVITTNLKSAFNCSKAAVKSMMRQRSGRIINIASVSGVLGNPGQTNYSASKAGLIGFTKSLAREVAPRNITVNAVAPGFVPTDLTSNLPETVKTETVKMIPLGRWGTADEIAHAVAFLASDEAAYITGQTLNVDGGMAM
ncbi:MAG TPA: 3-oxoacyl-[acyl-carrier-protein] reductase [Anaerolineales bacterium]|nr:3-oxoacyl-[acyl-carrier-protein] reductase [Anaerolineales bacterium]